MKKKLNKLALLFLCLLMAFAVACSNSNKESQTKEDVKENVAENKTTTTDVVAVEKKKVERLVVGTIYENNVFNSMTQSDAFGRMNYNSLTQGNFVYVDKNNEIQPFFFQSFDISDAGKTLVFTFPTNAVWHDGQPVTKEDILFTFDYQKNVKNSGYLKNLESWEITGENECTLKFTEPDAFYYLNAGALNICVHPKHIWENITDYKEYDDAAAAVGCGPFKLVSVDKDSQTSVYEAVYENNYAGEIMVDQVVVQSYSGEDTLMMAMMNGEIDAFFDYANPIDATIVDTMVGAPDINLAESDFGGHYQLTYGMERNPGSDINFRKAVRAALDYDKLANVIAGDYGTAPGTGIVPPTNKGYDSSLPILSRDLEAANKLLDEGGYKDTNSDGIRELPDGSPMDVMITLQFSKNMEVYNRIGEVITASLKDLGIKTHIDEESLRNAEVWEANVTDGKYDLFVGYTTSGMTSWSSAFRYFVGDPRFEGEKTWIWGTYHNEDFKNAFYAMQQSTSNEEYASYMKTLQHMADEDCFAQALCWEKGHFPYRTDKIAGWQDYPGWGVINSRTWFDVYQK